VPFAIVFLDTSMYFHLVCCPAVTITPVNMDLVLFCVQPAAGLLHHRYGHHSVRTQETILKILNRKWGRTGEERVPGSGS
jgi:hypothetical protein